MLLRMTGGCGKIIGLPRGFRKMMNFVFSVMMRKPQAESKECILSSVVCKRRGCLSHRKREQFERVVE